jgi:hypothetical protein
VQSPIHSPSSQSLTSSQRKVSRLRNNGTPTKTNHINPLSLQKGNFPIHLDILFEHPPYKAPSNARRKCRFCGKRTTHRCSGCQVSLHPPMYPGSESCFILFHLELWNRNDLISHISSPATSLAGLPASVLSSSAEQLPEEQTAITVSEDSL